MEFILIELGERNFTIAQKKIGFKDQYTFLASCRSRSRGQAEKLLALLNAKA